MSASAARVRRRPHHVVMLAYPDVQILDVTGPLEVFSRAARWMQDHGLRRDRSEEHTSELQSRLHLVCRLLLEKKKSTLVWGWSHTHVMSPRPSTRDTRSLSSRY